MNANSDAPNSAASGWSSSAAGSAGCRRRQHLATAPVDLTLVDRRNFHLFQPLTYQVATGALSPGEVAYPLRAIFRRQRNVRVLMAEVAGFDLDGPPGSARRTGSLPYDTLIVAGGSHYSYFGHDEWRRYAPEVKSLESALAARARILGAFEAAETEPDPDGARALLTFVVVGAGPTGVEMAGQIAELARGTLRGEFRSIDSASLPSPVDRDGGPRADHLPALAVAQSRALARVASASRSC